MQGANLIQRLRIAAIVFALLFTAAPRVPADDALPSWNDGAAKQAIVEFVARVTDENGEDYVRPTHRIAVFDNDGTLWCEQPIYSQVVFMFDRIRELAPQHPDWATTHPYQAILEGDQEVIADFGRPSLVKLAMAAQTRLTAEEFETAVSDWIAQAKHPRFGRLYTRCVYQPQLELLDYLRANGFKTFIVSGGGISFMRPWTERVYGIPREQVIGSRNAAELQLQDGKPVVFRQPKFDLVNDKEGKVVGIYQHIGLRPILAFGNSDGDMQMLQYTTGVNGARLGLVVRHTDAEREYAYDRESSVGRLDKVLDIADDNGWIVVDMRKEWNRVFPEP